MTEYVAKRRLYLGAGNYIEKGEPVEDLTPAEREPLVASGAVVKASPKQPAPKSKAKD